MSYNLSFIFNVGLPGSNTPGALDQQSVYNSPTLPDDSQVTVASLTSTLTTIQPTIVAASGNLCLECGLNR